MKALANELDQVLAMDPEAPALEFEKTWVSRGAIASAVRRIEELLAPYADGARVGVMVRNRPASVPAILACATARQCLVVVNPVAPDARLVEEVASLDVEAMIAPGRDWGRPGVLEAARRAGPLCIQLDDDQTVRILAPASHAPKPVAAHPDVALEMLTSGTTGKPKRIPIRREAMESAALATLNFESGRAPGAAPQARSGVQLLTGPISHMGGLLHMWNAILSGRRACLLERFTVESFHDAVKRHRPKSASIPPAALRMLLDAEVPPEDFSSLSVLRSATAPLAPELADRIYEVYGVPVLQTYGATEFGGVAGWTLSDFKARYAEKRGSVGRLNPGVEARTVDVETGAPLPPGQQGVLDLRGRQMGDGEQWVRTTDLAIVDADGFLFILGRIDNVIMRGGFKVDPDQVAAALQQHEAIREAAVIGLPDERLGQVPVAAYVLKADTSDPGADELATFLKARLMPYQVPVQFMRLPELPRTTSMKVSQLDLRELFNTKAGG